MYVCLHKTFPMKTTLTILMMLVVQWLASFAVCAQTVDPNTQDGKIYIKFKDQITLPFAVEQGQVSLLDVDFLKGKVMQYGLQKMSNPFYGAKDAQLERTFLLEFTAWSMADALIAELQNEDLLEYVEKVPVFKLFLIPNDTYHGDVSGFLGSANANWHLDAIHAEEAWDISTGSANIKVAVLDNGIYAAHPDLAGKIVAMTDLGDMDSDPTPPTADLTWSHGTHTAGLIGAASNNNLGVASIGYNVSLMAVKVGRDSDGALIAGYEGIFWAANNGADVISMSWGTPQYFQTMQNTINYAYNMGCVMVAASGNDGNDTMQYPAALQHVISVGSVDEGDGFSSFSCYGPWIDVCAPGGSSAAGALFSVLSTTYSDASFLGGALYGISGKYDVMSGTSMACPVVAGLCGLMLSVDSTMTPEKLENILKLNCDNIDAINTGHIGDMGAGRINAWRALQGVQDSTMTLVADFFASATTIMVDDDVNFTDQSIGGAISYSWSFPGGTPSTSSVQNPVGIVYSLPGFYPVTLTINDGVTSNTEVKTSFIMVKAPASSAWITQASGFTSQYRGIRNVSIVNPQVVWASAYDGSGGGANILEFTRTVDGGATWVPGNINIPTTCIVSELFAINDSIAWVATYGNTTGGMGIFKTIDGGATWNAQPTAVFSGTAAFPNTIYFWDALQGVCLGDPNGGYFEIYTTTDGGTTWVRVPQADIPAPASGEYGYNGGKDYDVIGDVMWWGTNKGNMFKSVDRGLHWTSYPTGLAEVANVTFNDLDHGLIEYKTYNTSTGAVVNFAIKTTADGGETWNTVNYTGDIFKSDVDAIPGHAGMYIATGSSQSLSECGSAFSLDFGQSWTKIDDSVQYTCVKFHDINTGWAGGFNSDATTEGIWKWMGLIQDLVNIIPDFIADSTTISMGHTVDFTDLSLGNITDWSWDFIGGTPATSTLQHPTGILYSAAGDYLVTLTCSNADTSVVKTKTAYIHVVDNSGVQEAANTGQIFLYPNPANDYVILSSAMLAGNFKMILFDVSGKVVQEQSLNLSKGASFSIPLTNVVAGLYTMELCGEGKVLHMKLVVE